MEASSSVETKLATAKTVLSAAASVAATAMLFRSIAQDFLPHEFQGLLFSGIRSFFNRFSSQITMVIDEFDGLVNNQIYEAAEIYLGGKISPNTQRLKVCKSDEEKDFTVAMERNEEVMDIFNGVKLNWVLVCRQVESRSFHNPRDLNSTLRSEVRSFELTFHKKHKDMVLTHYLPYIVQEAKSKKQEIKSLKIFTVSPDSMYGNLADVWTSTNLDHPATFDTVAMDLEIKNFILKDLERFVKRKEYYRKLTEIRVNSELRRLLIAMANKSILVVEDIDCTIEFQDRSAETDSSSRHSQQRQVTLSGLLNFIDGLWSSCGDERIIIFTTNHKDKLDSALLRPGRMDVHIHMSYCTPYGFTVLAANYLGIKEHALFGEIEEAIGTTQVTPAEVAEQLIKHDEPDIVLRGLIEFLKLKRIENEEAKAKKNEIADQGGDEEKQSDQEHECETVKDKKLDSDEKGDN
uniref:Uncharacterized protein n=1 Tax=Quercus lobata TaxID=97700 RepID=A0A7N2M090_QUELO